MAKHSASILDLAKRGARVRYKELQNELSSLAKQFPHLLSGAEQVIRRGRRAVNAVANELASSAPRRKRRKMSAAARTAISDAQKARWAKQRAAAKR